MSVTVLEPLDFTEDVDGNYTGPRGYVHVFGTDGHVYTTFICHGCQCCWHVDEGGEAVHESGPHYLEPWKRYEPKRRQQ